MDGNKYPPMLAVSSSPFDSQDYLFEVKWDGIRAIVQVEKDQTYIYSRNAYEISYRYPELSFSSQVDAYPAVLDGEIVVLSEGLPSFQTLQSRDHLKDPRKIRAAARDLPAVFMAFDLLQLGRDVITGFPLITRKKLLAEKVREGPNLAISQYVIGLGLEMFRLTKEKGLEGVVGKRLDSVYQVGKRSANWLKFRHTKSMSCVICGYVKGSGGRADLGSLVLGAFQDGHLNYVGNAGSGLADREIKYLLERFRTTTRETSPFAVAPSLKGIIWVEPSLVCEISYLEQGKVLRHPIFVGLRSDLSPEQCLLEQEEQH